VEVKGKVKFLTGHEGPELEKRYSYNLSLIFYLRFVVYNNCNKIYADIIQGFP